MDFRPLIGDDFKFDYNGDDYIQQQLLIAHLIDTGANTNAVINGQPPIITAARSISLVGALKVLLDKGANPDATDRRGKSALHFLGSPNALNRSGPVVRLNETAIRILLSHNASVSRGMVSCPFWLQPEHATVVSILLSLGANKSSIKIEEQL